MIKKEKNFGRNTYISLNIINIIPIIVVIRKPIPKSKRIQA